MAQTINEQEMVTIPKSALKALAEYAYPLIAWEGAWSQLQSKNCRLDDLHSQLVKERLMFLKEIFWKAYNEASKRERDSDPTRGYGGNPSLELFAEILVEMDDRQWGRPMPRKERARRNKAIKSKKAAYSQELARLNNPTPESVSRTMTIIGDSTVSIIQTNLKSEDQSIMAMAQAEIPRLLSKLSSLQVSA